MPNRRYRLPRLRWDANEIACWAILLLIAALIVGMGTGWI